MPKKRVVWTPEIEATICQQYEAGMKVLIIKMEHKIDPGSLYRILRNHKIPLRRPLKSLEGVMSSIDPTAERGKAEKVMEQVKQSWRPGDFFLTITPEDLQGLDDPDFLLVWEVLGLVVKNRSRRVAKDGKPD